MYCHTYYCQANDVHSMVLKCKIKFDKGVIIIVSSVVSYQTSIKCSMIRDIADLLNCQANEQYRIHFVQTVVWCDPAYNSHQCKLY